MNTSDPRAYSPSAERNRQPILDVLAGWLPATGLVLEIASGSGEHSVWFAERWPNLVWQPSDPDRESRRSIAAHAQATGKSTIRPPLDLDVSAEDWPIESCDAVVCINMVHISPWPATLGLLRGAARLLPPGGLLYLYGPYKRGGEHTAPSNAQFDASLRARNPAWGVRDLETLEDEARARGLALREVVEMPANNLSLHFSKMT